MSSKFVTPEDYYGSNVVIKSMGVVVKFCCVKNFDKYVE